jgi:hypothetical protein
MRFGAAETGTLLALLAEVCLLLSKVASLVSFLRFAMKRNDKGFAYFGIAFVNVRARLSARHRHVVMDEKVIALQRFSQRLTGWSNRTSAHQLLRTFHALVIEGIGTAAKLRRKAGQQRIKSLHDVSSQISASVRYGDYQSV